MFILRSLGVFLSTVFFGSISLAVSFFDPTGRRQNGVARVWAKSLLWVAGIRLTIEGLEHVDPEGAYIIAPNHVSYFDTPVLLSAIPVQFRFMAKKGLFHIPFLGTHLQRAGHIPVYRDDPRAGVKTLMAAADTVREKRVSVLVFPEGGRTEDGALQDFKEGAAYIAIRAGVPIVPVALIGTREVLPFGGGRIRSADVTLRVGEPIPTEALPLKQRGPLTDAVRERIVCMLGDTN
jgi:1-acyl-sn-glycerol-3-phosphate acyltransferase